MSARIAIAGGGPTGLMMARLLAADGHHVTVFEAGHEIGGLCRSREVDGYTFDLAGGHILFTKDERVARFWDELFADEPAHVSTRKTRILHDPDHWVSYPFENALGELPLEHNIACTEGVLRAHIDRQNGAIEPKDFRAWIRWKMGEGIAKHFMDPYNEKIWKADLASMGTSWIAGRVPDAPLEDVLRASLGSTTEGYTHQSVFRYPLNGGFADMHKRIARPIADSIVTGHRVRHIEQTKGDGWLVDGERFDKVVSTIPLHVLPDVIAGMDPDAAAAARNLKYRGVASYLVGLDHDEVPDYSWVYLPHKQLGPTNRITYLSNYSPNNAPTGKSSVMAEVTYAGTPPAIDKAGRKELAASLARAGVLDESSVTVTDAALNKVAYILYDLDFEAKRQRVVSWCDGQRGFHAVGRFGRYEYHNSDQCLGRAIDLHSAMAADLAAGR
ncbi:MAG: protoporphyrinogen oxidase [Pseudohongiellaceae bacterium]|jgi:protoporphyrinogen oxidase